VNTSGREGNKLRAHQTRTKTLLLVGEFFVEQNERASAKRSVVEKANLFRGKAVYLKVDASARNNGA
jgi:hypothetical protein